MKSMVKNKRKIIDINYESSKLSWYYYIPLLLIVNFVPLITYSKYVDLNGTTQALYWTGQNIYLDFFSFWKARWLVVLTIISLVTYIYLFLSKKLPLKKELKYYLPMAVYAIFVILSTIFAIDVETALSGFVDMYQGMWVLLSYVLVTFLAINYVNNEKNIKLFINAFVILIIIEGIIGVGQYFGFDIFNTNLGNHLILANGIKVDGGLNFKFGKYTIYGTLFNTNFVGSFATLMMPIAVVFLINSKTIKKRILAVCTLMLCLFTWIGCNSRAGYVGLFASVLVAIIMLRKYILKYWKYSLCVVLAGLIGLVGLNFASGGKVTNQLSRLNIIEEINRVKEENNNSELFKFKSIDINGNLVKIKTSHQELRIKLDGEKLYFLDQHDNILTMKTTEDGYLVVDGVEPSYLKLEISKNYPGFTVTSAWMPQLKLNFYISEDGIKILNNGGRLTLPTDAESIEFFAGLEQFASNRGYIWSRSVPLLNDYIIVGAGPDNYTYAFPQDDMIAKANTYYDATVVVDKPHNMFLQIAINTGVISLIALLIFWSIYLITSLKLYWNMRYDSLEKLMGLACMLSVIGYLVAGIFNDQIVSVAPLFWIIIGIGISINTRLISKLKNKEKIV